MNFRVPASSSNPTTRCTGRLPPRSRIVPASNNAPVVVQIVQDGHPGVPGHALASLDPPRRQWPFWRVSTRRDALSPAGSPTSPDRPGRLPLRPGDDHHSQDQKATCCCQRAAGGRCRHGHPDCSTPAAMKAVAAARRLGLATKSPAGFVRLHTRLTLVRLYALSLPASLARFARLHALSCHMPPNGPYNRYFYRFDYFP